MVRNNWRILDMLKQIWVISRNIVPMKFSWNYNKILSRGGNFLGIPFPLYK